MPPSIEPPEVAIQIKHFVLHVYILIHSDIHIAQVVIALLLVKDDSKPYQ